MEQRNHHRKSHYRFQSNSSISARPTLHRRRQIRTRTQRAVRFADTIEPRRSRATLDVAPERVQVGDVVEAEIGTSSGVVWKDLGASAALGHDCCAVCARGQSAVGNRGIEEAREECRTGQRRCGVCR
jgi:hypothetical protein